MKKNRRLILIGASGHGKVCAEIAKLNNSYSDIYFLDDNTSLKKCGEYDVFGTSSDFHKYINDETDFFVSIGNHEHRKRIQEAIESSGGILATLIHPNAIISEGIPIGNGSVIMAGAIITVGAKIGKGVIINTACSVDHDCKIGHWSHISVGAHICGTVEVGNECWIGAGATVSNNIKIHDNVLLGAGAVVVKDITSNGTYIGVPSKKLVK